MDTYPEFPTIFRQEGNKLTDEELLKLLTEFRKPDKMSKLTVIPGSLKIKITSLTDLPDSKLFDFFRIISKQQLFLNVILDSLTTSLSPLKQFPIPPTNEPTIELTEFEGSSERDIHPYTTFTNHLYVYPQCLSFDTQKAFTRARNIACIVELRDSDSEGAKGIPVIIIVTYFIFNSI